jgi:hypothetical protein
MKLNYCSNDDEVQTTPNSLLGNAFLDKFNQSINQSNSLMDEVTSDVVAI